jgi:transaldolase
VKIFCDSASVTDILKYIDDPSISGFTTNPTLMKKEGIIDYLKFAKEVLETAKGKPVSFEVFSQNTDEMKRQALLLSSLGKNVYVKITPLNYDSSSLVNVINKLSYMGVQLNVTAVFTTIQVKEITHALNPSVNSIISIFAGRIADAGVDPEPIIKESKKIITDHSSNWEILWASPREVFNIIQAERSGADIITATPELLTKRKFFGKDLEQFSLETARMFMDDARAAGYKL